MLNPIIYYPAAVTMILFALLAIKFKNIFYSLLCAIIVFFIAGLFFYILGSEYNAVIQIAIYGVAIPVILGLAVMFTNHKKDEKNEIKNSNLKYIMSLTGGIFILALIYLTKTSFVISPSSFTINEKFVNTPVLAMNAFSNGIFIQYVWAFELLSLILTIIVVGITLFNKKEEN